MALSQIALQHLRTPVATKLPDGLKPGQIAFNLANKWLMVGCTGDDVLVHGKAVAAGAATIYGVTNVVVPAKVATARPATGAVAGSMYQGEGFETSPAPLGLTSRQRRWRRLPPRAALVSQPRLICVQAMCWW